MDCSICCEKFNKSNRFEVVCKGCTDNSSACRSCCQTFILINPNDPMCMFCKNPWDRDFLNENLTQKFVNKDLKLHSENIFVERQISLLPDTQKAAMVEKRIRDTLSKLSEANSELNRIKKMLHDQHDIIKAYNLEIFRLRNGTSQEDTKVENFTHKCNTSGCNGFLDNRYFCNLCETKVCRHCMEVKEEDHECNEETKATIQAIKREAKPCPGCGEMISKIDGCDQMWCIKCHIQFSWRTGAQMTGYNHNPEYFRWMRETGQEIHRNPHAMPVQVVCGQRFDDRTIYTIISNLFPKSKDTITFYHNMYMFYRHTQWKIQNIDIDESIERELKNLRIKYLLNDITRDQWKKSVQQLDKKNKKHNSYANVWRLIETVLLGYIEEIITIQNEDNCRIRYIEIIKEAEKFRMYTNESFIKISNTFGSTTCPGIGPSWREIYNYKQYIKKENLKKQNKRES